jgi:5-oxoprolinase (ATP-hydrolysing) subunit A
MKLTTLDLNADLGETVNDYLELLSVITTANVACGGHAGGGELLKQTVKACVESNVQVGAHPSYPDRENFGRVSLRDKFSKVELTALISEQIKLVLEELATHGKQLSHVKAHGALYNDAMAHQDVAEALIDAVKPFGVPIFGLPNSALDALAKQAGIIFIPEGYMDRAYTNQGTLVPRSLPGAVLEHEAALTQIEQLAVTGTVVAIDGTVLELELRTICIHADTPDAGNTARSVRTLLVSNGISIQHFEASL